MIGPPRNERTLHRILHGNSTTKPPNFNASPVNQTNHRNHQGRPTGHPHAVRRTRLTCKPRDPAARRRPPRTPARTRRRRWTPGGARGRGRRGRQRRRQGRRPREWEPDDRRRRRRLLLPAGPRGEQRLVEAARLLLPLPRHRLLNFSGRRRGAGLAGLAPAPALPPRRRHPAAPRCLRREKDV